MLLNAAVGRYAAGQRSKHTNRKRLHEVALGQCVSVKSIAASRPSSGAPTAPRQLTQVRPSGHPHGVQLRQFRQRHAQVVDLLTEEQVATVLRLLLPGGAEELLWAADECQ